MIDYDNVDKSFDGSDMLKSGTAFQMSVYEQC